MVRDRGRRSGSACPLAPSGPAARRRAAAGDVRADGHSSLCRCRCAHHVASCQRARPGKPRLAHKCQAGQCQLDDNAYVTLLRDRVTGSTLDERHDHVLAKSAPGTAIATWAGRRFAHQLADLQNWQVAFPDAGDELAVMAAARRFLPAAATIWQPAGYPAISTSNSGSIRRASLFQPGQTQPRAADCAGQDSAQADAVPARPPPAIPRQHRLGPRPVLYPSPLRIVRPLSAK